MGLERGNGDAHPLVQRQSAEQTVELRSTVGAVQAEDRPVAGPFPDPDEMPFARQPGRGGRLGVLAVLDLGLRSSVRNVELELD